MDDFEKFLQDSRKTASTWAKWMLKDPKAVIMDSETTDLNGEIIDLAIINMAGEVLFDKLIRPIGAISKEATAIHGIDQKAVAGAPLFLEVYPRVKSILESASAVVIYNAQFDTDRLYRDCLRYKLSNPKFFTNCAMLEYAKFIGEWNDHFQSFRWQKLEGGDHRALGDCRATLKVLKRMARET